jgi:hypothetical protein
MKMSFRLPERRVTLSARELLRDPGEEKRHLEGSVFRWLTVLVLALLATYLVIRWLADPHGGPGSMFDGWIVLLAAVPALFALGAAFCLLAAVYDLVCFQISLRFKQPGEPGKTPALDRRKRD